MIDGYENKGPSPLKLLSKEEFDALTVQEKMDYLRSAVKALLELEKV